MNIYLLQVTDSNRCHWEEDERKHWLKTIKEPEDWYNLLEIRNRTNNKWTNLFEAKENNSIPAANELELLTMSVKNQCFDKKSYNEQFVVASPIQYPRVLDTSWRRYNIVITSRALWLLPVVLVITDCSYCLDTLLMWYHVDNAHQNSFMFY